MSWSQLGQWRSPSIAGMLLPVVGSGGGLTFEPGREAVVAMGRRLQRG